MSSALDELYRIGMDRATSPQERGAALSTYLDRIGYARVVGNGRTALPGNVTTKQVPFQDSSIAPSSDRSTAGVSVNLPSVAVITAAELTSDHASASGVTGPGGSRETASVHKKVVSGSGSARGSILSIFSSACRRRVSWLLPRWRRVAETSGPYHGRDGEAE